MKTRFGTVLPALLAVAIACGGSQQAGEDARQRVYVETESALTIGDVASMEVSGTGATVGAVGPFVLTYSTTTGKFSGNLYLTPDTYSLTLTARRANNSVIGTATTTNVVVTNTGVKTVSLNVSSILEPVPAAGFVITGFAGEGYIATGNTANFSVTVATAGPAPTYAWTQSTGCGGTFGTPAAAASTFTKATAGVCTITVTVTDSVNTSYKLTRSAQIGVGVDLTISGTFVPSPTITQVVLINNGGYSATTGLRTAEATCTIARTGSSAERTCAGSYKINSGPPVDPAATPLVLTVPQFRLGISYDLGGVYDATKPPAVGVTASCPNATTNGVSLYSFSNVPANPIAGSGPGTATCPPAPAVCSGSASLWWTEPIAFVAPATADLCTLTFTVNNQGALDSMDVYLLVTQ